MVWIRLILAFLSSSVVPSIYLVFSSLVWTQFNFHAFSSKVSRVFFFLVLRKSINVTAFPPSRILYFVTSLVGFVSGRCYNWFFSLLHQYRSKLILLGNLEINKSQNFKTSLCCFSVQHPFYWYFIQFEGDSFHFFPISLASHLLLLVIFNWCW